jgi:hypothetical protein
MKISHAWILVAIIAVCVCVAFISATSVLVVRNDDRMTTGREPWTSYSMSAVIRPRYVKLLAARRDCMNVNEVEVINEKGLNVALGKPVVMSSGYGNDRFPGGNLTNGDIKNTYRFAHTSCYDVGWMMIDLGSTHEVSKVIVHNRQDCCHNRLVGTVVQMLDEQKKILWVSPPLNDSIVQNVFVGYQVNIILPKLTIDVASLSAIRHEGEVKAWGPAVAHVSGSHPYPVVMRADKHPFVRIGSSKVNHVEGNYLDFSTQTFRGETNSGFAFVGCIRMNGKNTWERIFDFGSGAGHDNIVLSRYGNSTQYISHYWGAENYGITKSSHEAMDNEWHVVIFIKTQDESIIFIDGVRYGIRRVGLVNKNMSRCYVGKSHWGHDSYAFMDIREALWFDGGIRIDQVQKITENLKAKYS